MEQSPKEIAETEGIPLGQITISLGESSFGNSENSRMFAAKVKAIVSELIERQHLSLCAIIRRVIVARNFEKEVEEWQRSLGRLVGTTNTAEGIAVGKTLVWGDGGATSTYGVVIVREHIAADLLKDEPLVRGLIAHEFAHGFDHTMLLREIGEQPHPSPNNWPGIRRYIATTIWSEFFAEAIAFPFYGGTQVEVSLKLAAETLHGALRRADLEICQYRLHADVGRTWGIVCQEVSHSLTQVGRTLGQVAGASKNGDNRFEDLGRLVTEISPEWNSIAKSLWEGLSSCSKQHALSVAALAPIETQVCNAFRHFGAFPQETPDGLWIDFP